MESWSFAGEWHQRYQRNNKRTGQKNLRCFPCCSASGHNKSGFCGQPIELVVTLREALAKDVILKAWGGFIVCGTDETHKVGDVFEEKEFKDRERTREQVTNHFLRGEVVPTGSENGKTVMVMFNQALLGWHYHWVSTKHTCDSFHTFKAQLFIQDEQGQKNGNFKYLGCAYSPQFQLYSRRRQRGVLETDSQNQKRIKTDSSAIAAGSMLQLGNSVVSPVPDARMGPFTTADIGGSMTMNEFFKSQHQTEEQQALMVQQLFALQAALPGNVQHLLMQMSHQQQHGIVTSDPQTGIGAILEQENTVHSEKDDPPVNKEKDQDTKFDRYYDEIFAMVDKGIFQNKEIVSHMRTFERIVMFLFQHTHGTEYRQPAESKHDSGDDFDDYLDEFSSSIFQGLLADLAIPSEEHKDQGSKTVSETTRLPITSSSSSSLSPKVPSTAASEKSSKEQEPATFDGNAGFTRGYLRLRELALNHGTAELKRNVETLLAALEDFSTRLVAEREFSDEIQRLFKTHSKSKEAVEKVVQNLKDEEEALQRRPDIDMQTLWMYEILYNKRRGTKAKTISAQVRQIIQQHVFSFLNEQGRSIGDFDELMEIAARYKLLPLDPDVPPGPLELKFMHMQLYGNHKNLDISVKFGENGRFHSKAFHDEWKSMLFLFKRKSFRRIIINRIKAERLIAMNASKRGKPVAPCYNIAGSWMRTSSLLKIPKVLTSLVETVTGLQFGSFATNIFNAMFQRLDITISQETLLVQGENKFLSSPSMLFHLDHKVHTVEVPLPVAISTLSTSRNYIAWFSKDEQDEKHYVNIVLSGVIHLPGITGGTNDSPPSPEQLAAANLEARVLRIALRFHISMETKQNLSADFAFKVYEKDEVVPQLTETLSHSSLFLPSNAKLHEFSNLSFVRMWDDTDYGKELEQFL